MREILFRGKRVDNDEWVCGSFCMDAIEQLKGLCGIDGFIRLYDKTNNRMQMHAVDRETVGQYTGLKDKNGKRIFEGDMVRFRWDVGRNYFFLIEFVDGEFCATPILCLDDVWQFRIREENKKLEVIGNIHDNPELMGGAEDG